MKIGESAETAILHNFFKICIEYAGTVKSLYF